MQDWFSQQHPVAILLGVAALLIVTYWITFTAGHQHAIAKRRQALEVVTAEVNASGTIDDKRAFSRIALCETPTGPEVFNMDCIRKQYADLQAGKDDAGAAAFDRLVHRVVEAGR